MKGDRVLRRHGGREKREAVVGGFNSNAKDNSGTIEIFERQLIVGIFQCIQCSG